MQIQDLLQQSGATLVDVREVGEFQMGHAENAINIPLSSLQQRLTEFEQMSKPIIVYCQSGNRSGMAAAILSARGVQEVYNGGGLRQIQSLQQPA
jgi:phage shock protein E